MDKLAFRLEFHNQGPFYDHSTFHQIQNLILTYGGSVDDCGTTFLNLYDQRTADEMVFRNPFKEFLEQYKDCSLRFGFLTKEDFIEQFGIENQDWRDNPYQNQFRNTLNEIKALVVKVYLVNPLRIHKAEILYHKSDAELIEIAPDYQSFLDL